MLGFPEVKHGRRRDAQRADAQPSAGLGGGLSGRELQILRHVASGMPNKLVARQLGISESTVRNHLSQIFKKLHAANRVEAVINALKGGLVVF